MKSLFEMFQSCKGQLVSNINGLVVAIVALVAIAIPVTQSVIDTSNLTGLTAIIVSFLPVFIGLGALTLVSRVAA